MHGGNTERDVKQHLAYIRRCFISFQCMGEYKREMLSTFCIAHGRGGASNRYYRQIHVCMYVLYTWVIYNNDDFENIIGRCM